MGFLRMVVAVFFVVAGLVFPAAAAAQTSPSVKGGGTTGIPGLLWRLAPAAAILSA
jgi:hypothetical protein